LLERDVKIWDCDSIRRLKYRLDRTPALQLLAELHVRRTPLGAFNLLVALGVWKKHEDLALLRSGFPLRFTNDEWQAARQVQLDSTSIPSRIRDPDHLLGLRRDMTTMKVYTIDSASTSEVDDGISLEVLEREDGTKRNRIWVHIADVSRWAPHRNSPLFQIARKRITSLYLPNRSISMFPPSISTELMSLKANTQRYALSLAVQINDDGSVDPSSVIITPSLIRPSYRLTYDEVDEMLEEGIGYKEEWELGALLDAATLRRNYRIRQGSTEGIIPNPVPYSTISVYPDRHAPDGLGIAHHIQVSHNAGKNVTALAEEAEGGANYAENDAASTPSPVSSAYLLVTEMMILAGEAIGQFKSRIDEERMQIINGEAVPFANQLRLAFRTQLPPDLKSRAREKRTMLDLLEYNVGNGYCHAWYYRRFMQPMKVMEMPRPHAGLGLPVYVQWTSPIRRFSDLLVHISVKRYLRRKRVYELLKEGVDLPLEITAVDLGFPPGSVCQGKITIDGVEESELDQDINFLEGIGLIGAARLLQRRSHEYWLFEYVQRLRTRNPDLIYTAIVLGMADPEKNQYAIYVEQLGLEHRYSAPGPLNAGTKLQLKVDKISPRGGILSFVQAI